MKEILSDMSIKGRLDVTGAVSAGEPEGPNDLVTVAHLEKATDGYVGELDRHTQDFENPHRVTKAQVGLGDVENYSLADMPIPAKVQSALDGKADRSDLSTIYRPMGSVKYFADLPKEPYVHVGDVYDVRETGMNYVWVIRDGVGVWDELGLGIDINNYYTVDEVNEIEKGLSDRIDDEASDREKADTTLQANIDAEAQTRADADAVMGKRIDDEVQARKDADTTLQTNIDNEATARQTADTTLQTNIDTEVTNRTNADTTLQNNIDAEAQARTSADGVLQANIDAETQARKDADTALDTAKVNRAGDTMTGTLEMLYALPSIQMKSDSLVYSDDVKESTTVFSLMMSDKNNNFMGGLFNRWYLNGDRKIYLENKGKDGKMGQISLWTNPSGVYAEAPSPSDKSDNSYKIATTGWVNQSDFLVHTTGNETISGDKMFTFRPIVKTNNKTEMIKFINSGANLSSAGTYQVLHDINFYGIENNAEVSYSKYIVATGGNGELRTVFQTRRNVNGTMKYGEIEVDVLADGSALAKAPSTPSSATSNEIATAGWVIGKISAQVTLLQDGIDAEAQARTEADTTLQANVDEKVAKAGDTMTGDLHIPTNATGTRDDVAVNGNRVQADLDAYAHMVRTSGNQTIYGNKDFKNRIGIYANSLIVARNVNGLTLNVLKLDVDITNTHTVCFTVISRAGIDIVRFLVFSGGSEINNVNIIGHNTTTTIGLVLSTDGTNLYLGFNGSVYNTEVMINNLIVYRAGNRINNFEQVEIDNSTMVNTVIA